MAHKATPFPLASSDVAAVALSGSASDLSAGTLPAARLPALTGDVTSSAGSAATTLAAGSAAALNSGTLLAGRMPALTGDVTTSAGAVATAIGTSKVLTTMIADANVTLAKLANLANATVIGRNTSGTGVPEAVTMAQLLVLLGIPAPIADTTTGSNVQDLSVTVPSTNNKAFEFEGKIITSNAAIGAFSIQPNTLATNQTAVQFIAISGSPGSAFYSAFTNLALADNTGAAGAGFIAITYGKLTQGNSGNWEYQATGYQEDGAGNKVYFSVSGEWQVTTALTSIRVHCSVAAGIRTNSWFRVRQVYP